MLLRALTVVNVVIVALALAVPGVAAAQALPPAPQKQREVEILTHKPSGFWTSNRPAEGGAYKWRLLALGVLLAGVTGIVMLRLVRRANAQRAQR